MEFKNVSKQDLNESLRLVNEKYENNVIWNNPYKTLRVKDSRGKGARLSITEKTRKDGSTYRRHITSACWHVHGDFFDCLLKVNPEAVIIVSTNKGKRKIYKDSNGEVIGNWEDWNVGSVIYPVYHSELCDCNKHFY